MYYLPLASGYWKTFGKPLDAFWCCTGTGSEEYAKLADTIYWHGDFQNDDSLYVNLYIASQLDWPGKNLQIKQETRFPEEPGTTITISAKSPQQLAINLRIPYWAEGGSVKINGTTLPAFASPGSYLTLNRVWKPGDKIELSLPMSLHIHAMPDDESIQAAMYGPLVLAGRFDAVTKNLTYSGYGPKSGTQAKVPDIAVDPAHPTAWLEPDSRLFDSKEPDAKQRVAFHAVGQAQPITLVPLNQVIHERYAVYWKVKNESA
jgi:DUF1680 family protein